MKTAGIKPEKKRGTLREKFRPWEEYADIVDAVVGTVLWMAVILFVICAVLLSVRAFGNTRPAGEGALGVPALGVGRMPTEEGAETEYLLDSYTEGEGPAPEWWDPEEPMAAEWTAETERRDIGCPDWNLESSLTGWDGHRAEIWEMDLFARIFYKEFWQPDLTLCEAGCDAILRLWESGEKGRTLGEVLSSTAENGAWTYSTYPEVWATDYDPDGLAWCRAFCEARFYAGPVWIAPYFRLDYYHDWAVPAYQIGNVYFSVGAQG